MRLMLFCHFRRWTIHIRLHRLCALSDCPIDCGPSCRPVEGRCRVIRRALSYHPCFGSERRDRGSHHGYFQDHYRPASWRYPSNERGRRRCCREHLAAVNSRCSAGKRLTQLGTMQGASFVSSSIDGLRKLHRPYQSASFRSRYLSSYPIKKPIRHPVI